MSELCWQFLIGNYFAAYRAWLHSKDYDAADCDAALAGTATWRQLGEDVQSLSNPLHLLQRLKQLRTHGESLSCDSWQADVSLPAVLCMQQLRAVRA